MKAAPAFLKVQLRTRLANAATLRVFGCGLVYIRTSDDPNSGNEVLAVAMVADSSLPCSSPHCAHVAAMLNGGWNKLRETIFANQKRLGIMPENAKLTAWTQVTAFRSL